MKLPLPVTGLPACCLAAGPLAGSHLCNRVRAVGACCRACLREAQLVACYSSSQRRNTPPNFCVSWVWFGASPAWRASVELHRCLKCCLLQYTGDVHEVIIHIVNFLLGCPLSVFSCMLSAICYQLFTISFSISSWPLGPMRPIFINPFKKRPHLGPFSVLRPHPKKGYTTYAR